MRDSFFCPVARCDNAKNFPQSAVALCETLFSFQNALSQPTNPILKTIWHIRSLRQPFTKLIGACYALFSLFQK